jgi:putative ABC transport system permease protein
MLAIPPAIDGEILREPDGAMDLYNFVPRLMFNSADLSATGLIQEGSRARWRLMLAGDDRQISDFRQWLSQHLPAGSRLENVEEARPEIRTALERARRFLGLTAMLTVALSAAAVALAVRRYLAGTGSRWRCCAAWADLVRGAGPVCLPVSVAGLA